MTDKRKVQIYEHFMHQLQLYSSVNLDKYLEGINLIHMWSYSHRMDTLTEEQREKNIINILFKMKDF